MNLTAILITLLWTFAFTLYFIFLVFCELKTENWIPGAFQFHLITPFVCQPLWSKLLVLAWGYNDVPVQNSQCAFSPFVSLQWILWCAWLLMSACCLSSLPKGCLSLWMSLHTSFWASPPSSFLPFTHAQTHLLYLYVCVCRSSEGLVWLLCVTEDLMRRIRSF